MDQSEQTDKTEQTEKEQITQLLEALTKSDSELSYEERLSIIKDSKTLIEQLPQTESVEKSKYKAKIMTIEKDINSLSWIEVYSVSGAFLKDKPLNVPFWGMQGDSLKVVFKSDQTIPAGRIYETKSGRDVKKFSNFKQIEYAFDVYFNSVFNLNFTPSKGIYYDVVVYRKPKSVDSKFARHSIKKDSIVHEKRVENSVLAYELISESVYYEPQKYTMKNSFWSGKTPIYAAIEVPKETKYFVYTMVVTGEDNERYNPKGNKLLKEVQTKTSKYRVLGIPVFSSESSSESLIRDLINTLSTPSRVEGQSLDLYFVESQGEVKKFLNGQSFKYDIDNSVLGTQSRKGIV
ncbi:MAG: hypothetical protein VKL39_24690, partial [Leptolyngbyaceae bacterium]|nr:hypothetical protein [Leptolyngbyaceae bacterium]